MRNYSSDAQECRRDSGCGTVFLDIPRRGSLATSEPEPVSGTDGIGFVEVYVRLDQMQVQDDDLIIPGWQVRSDRDEEIVAYRTGLLVYLKDLTKRTKASDALASSRQDCPVTRNILRECYSEICSTARFLRIKIENWMPEYVAPTTPATTARKAPHTHGHQDRPPNQMPGSHD